MSLQSFLDNIFVWKENFTWSAPSDLTPSPATDNEINAIFAQFTRLYNGSQAIRDLVDNYSSPIRYGVTHDPEIAATMIPLSGTKFHGTLSYILVNPTKSIYMINQFGSFQEMNKDIVLAHELYHYITLIKDPNIDQMTDEDFNDPNKILIGSAVQFQNLVSDQMSISGHRLDYADGFDQDHEYFSVLSGESSWSLGHEVDVVRIGGSGNSGYNNEIDYSQWGSDKSVLVIGLGGIDHIIGSGGNDFLHGNSASDTIEGGAGNDIIFGNSPSDLESDFDGKNTLSGGIGDDILIAGRHGDTLYGDEDNDRLKGGVGDDTLVGDGGDDKIWGEGGNDSVDGGAGKDIIVLSNLTPGSLVRVAGGADNDTVHLGRSADRAAEIANPTTYNFVDSDAGDILYWNGYQLHGGTWTVLIERLSPDINDGYGLWVDNHGVIYDYHENSVLSITLPDNTQVSVADFQNGDWGLTFNDAPNFYPWPGDGLPRAATAGLIPVNESAGDLFWRNADMLDGRVAAAFTPGPVDMPTFTFA